MGKHLSDSLYGPCCLIFSSDDDQPLVMDIYAGFNIFDQLVIAIDFTDYDEPEYNCSTAVVVKRADSCAMARHHRVKHSQLPRLIADSMEEWWEIINPSLAQAVECFKEITERLLDEGCRFRIKRTYGYSGHICC